MVVIGDKIAQQKLEFKRNEKLKKKTWRDAFQIRQTQSLQVLTSICSFKLYWSGTRSLCQRKKLHFKFLYTFILLEFFILNSKKIHEIPFSLHYFFPPIPLFGINFISPLKCIEKWDDVKFCNCFRLFCYSDHYISKYTLPRYIGNIYIYIENNWWWSKYESEKAVINCKENLNCREKSKRKEGRKK